MTSDAMSTALRRHANSTSAASDEQHSMRWLLIVVTVPCLLIAPFCRDLWHRDEVRYIEAARQMDLAHTWLLPHLNGQIYEQKPPFFFWCVMVVERVIGDYRLAGQVVVGLSMLATLGLILRVHRRLFGSTSNPYLPALLFATTAMTILHGQSPVIDPLLVGLTLATTVSLLDATRGNLGRRSMQGIAAALAMTAGCLTKGPVAVAIPIVSAAALLPAWRAADGTMPAERRAVRESASFILAAVVAIACAAVVTLCWLYAASQVAGQGYWDHLLYQQTANRVRDSWSHAEPWTFYFEKLAVLWLPWVLFLPRAIAAAFDHEVARRDRRALRCLLVLVALALVAFSSVSGKRSGYLFPILPFFAIAIARGLELGTTRHGFVDRVTSLLRGVFIITGGVLVIAPWAVDALPAIAPEPRRAMCQIVADGLGVGSRLALSATGVVILVAASRRFRAPLSTSRIVGGLAAIVALLSLTAHLTLVRSLDRWHSFRPFADEVRRRCDLDSLVALAAFRDPYLTHFTGKQRYRLILEPREIDAAFAEPGRLWIVAHQRELGRLERLGHDFEVVIGPEFGAGRYCLLRER